MNGTLRTLLLEKQSLSLAQEVVQSLEETAEL